MLLVAPGKTMGTIEPAPQNYKADGAQCTFFMRHCLTGRLLMVQGVAVASFSFIGKDGAGKYVVVEERDILGEWQEEKQ